MAGGTREYMVRASDAEEAIDRAIEQAEAGNRLARAKWPDVRKVDRELYKVRVYVTEAAR